MGWVLPAYKKEELRITSDNSCPYDDPEKECHPNAHREHLWVSESWFKWWYKSKFGVFPVVKNSE